MWEILLFLFWKQSIINITEFHKFLIITNVVIFLETILVGMESKFTLKYFN